jgi:hypothetical protein
MVPVSDGDRLLGLKSCMMPDTAAPSGKSHQDLKAKLLFAGKFASDPAHGLMIPATLARCGHGVCIARQTPPDNDIAARNEG